MESQAGMMLTGVAAFAATNLDDLFLLVVLFAAGTGRARDIVLGQYAGIAFLFAASVLASLASMAIAPAYLCLLGVIPVLIGMKQIVAGQAAGTGAPPRTAILSVAAATVANGGDNVGVYLPLFATSSAPAIITFGAVFTVMTGAWCLAARWLVHHPAAGAPLRRHGPKLAPWVLVALGLAILAC